MAVTINGWKCIANENRVVTAGAGDNRLACFEYLQIVPTVADARVLGWDPPDGPSECQWIMEVANADPTQVNDILLIGGLPAQDPPEIVLPSGFTQVRIKPAFTQRVYYQTGIGWVPLFAGTLEP